MSQGDNVPWGPPPELIDGHSAFGACAVHVAGREDCGVRIMLKGFEVMTTPDGPVAYVALRAGGAVQAVQALRQAITDARQRRTR